MGKAFQGGGLSEEGSSSILNVERWAAPPPQPETVFCTCDALLSALSATVQNQTCLDGVVLVGGQARYLA